MTARADCEEVALSYGDDTRTVLVPRRNLLVGHFGSPADPIDAGDVLAAKLAQLDGAAILARLERPGARVTILVDDYTRPTPARDIVPGLLDWLNEKGVTDDRVDVLMATGFHRPMTRAEIDAKVGPSVPGRVRIHMNDALDYDNMTLLGETSQGIPVWINKLATEADVVIGVGMIEVHALAGFSGGPKIVCPGAAGKKTIDHTHALAGKPGVEIGSLEGNTFRENCLEAARMAGLDLVVNVVLDSRERAIGLFVGPPEEAQREGVEFFRNVNALHFPQRADIVLTTANPKYQYWGQAVISSYNAARVVKPGGVRITLAACPEGLGDSDAEADFYRDALTREWNDPEVFWRERIGEDACQSRRAAVVYLHLAFRCKSDIVLVTDGFPPEAADFLSLAVVDDPQQALDDALARVGPDATVAAYDMGAMILPVIDEP